ncbi:HAMP domain-containing protein [Lusitaniella coriacea LEGE 07157]|uniref:HAMP domain-containing protein n=1 Tax=Lusitaniella coriacea LEGE 07157 TaxID=945747 RepID=A0A8J7DY20_9CYAN|nr:methyl-accepting chemotaxis protein [Lusitaniella coriacea]MBE9117323.1 HAMP domain-containing protein [Lusitaniella coriacea LEGE 07157]
MAQSTDYAQEYGQAEQAYIQGRYDEAATIVDRLAKEYDDDPSVQLLRGHIYCYGLQQYDVAQEQYELVLQLTDRQDFIGYANNGIEDVGKFRAELGDASYSPAASSDDALSVAGEENGDDYSADLPSENFEQFSDYEDFPGAEDDRGLTQFDMSYPDEESTGNGNSDYPTNSTLEQHYGLGEEASAFGEDSGTWMNDVEEFPASEEVFSEAEPDFSQSNEESLDDPFGAEMLDDAGETMMSPTNGTFEQSSPFSETEEPFSEGLEGDWSGESDPFAEELGNSWAEEESNLLDSPAENGWLEEDSNFGEELGDEGMPQSDSFAGASANGLSDEPYGMDDLGMAEGGLEDLEESDNREIQETLLMQTSPSQDTFPMTGKNLDDSFEEENFASSWEEEEEDYSASPENELDSAAFETGSENLGDFSFDEYDSSVEMDSFEEDREENEVGEDTFSKYVADSEGFLDDFAGFDEDISIPDLSSGEFNSDLALKSQGESTDASFGFPLETEAIPAVEDESSFTLSGASDSVPSANFTKTADRAVEPTVEIEQGYLSWFENAALKKKQWLIACIAGATSAVAVALVSFLSSTTTPAENKAAIVPRMRISGTLMALAAGASSFGTSVFLGRLASRQINRSTDDLQSQFEAVSQGNLNAKATVYAEDEFGQLAASFNEMARVILTTTSEAQRRAEETEQQKEDLQRQVIRLLDDVEGAARGDLTVRAEVTADVLGAVADAFNLTIQNLREIVQQVKEAARQVNKNSSENEQFARNLQQDALRQAEELAVTLNSVQMMTDSIRRVADNAKEAEEVARSAADVAVKGGESVEHTVSGILQIRETVAETARKVKRLAEASQEISKIVAAIAQIASRTNLLALNASIEAARAGEAGRGFAIVADEVRQLADKSAKALKEIEQNVLQIQSETSSVMTAMEEGVTQVIDVTQRAEQAKRSLEDIIQVSNRIDALVRSITADTVEQTESTLAVAQVMQSVELTAQETSQESQRVSGSLQSQVSIARSLLASVERFRVDTTEGA